MVKRMINPGFGKFPEQLCNFLEKKEVLIIHKGTLQVFNKSTPYTRFAVL
jgi:hypothetical protein